MTTPEYHARLSAAIGRMQAEPDFWSQLHALKGVVDIANERHDDGENAEEPRDFWGRTMLEHLTVNRFNTPDNFDPRPPGYRYADRYPDRPAPPP